MFEHEIGDTTKRGNCCLNDQASQSEYVNSEQLAVTNLVRNM